MAIGSQFLNSRDEQWARGTSMWNCLPVGRWTSLVECFRRRRFLQKYNDNKKPQHPRNRTCCHKPQATSHTMNVIIAIETLSRNNCIFNWEFPINEAKSIDYTSLCLLYKSDALRIIDLHTTSYEKWAMTGDRNIPCGRPTSCRHENISTRFENPIAISPSR